MMSPLRRVMSQGQPHSTLTGHTSSQQPHSRRGWGRLRSPPKGLVPSSSGGSTGTHLEREKPRRPRRPRPVPSTVGGRVGRSEDSSSCTRQMKYPSSSRAVVQASTSPEQSGNSGCPETTTMRDDARKKMALRFMIKSMLIWFWVLCCRYCCRNNYCVQRKKLICWRRFDSG